MQTQITETATSAFRAPRSALLSAPGTARSTEKRATRRSKGARRGFRNLRLHDSLTSGLEPILFHPPVQGAAAQAKRFRRLTHVALKALQRFANQNSLNRFKTQFF